jgi:hypothetical protein
MFRLLKETAMNLAAFLSFIAVGFSQRYKEQAKVWL